MKKSFLTSHLHDVHPLPSSIPQPALLLSPQHPLLCHNPHSFLRALLVHFPQWNLSSPGTRISLLRTEPGVTGVQVFARWRKNHHGDLRYQALFHRPYRYKFLWSYQPHFTGGGPGSAGGGGERSSDATPTPLSPRQSRQEHLRLQGALQAADTERSGREAGVCGRDSTTLTC